MLINRLTTLNPNFSVNPERLTPTYRGLVVSCQSGWAGLTPSAESHRRSTLRSNSMGLEWSDFEEYFND
jgi:hypothetical protein